MTITPHRGGFIILATFILALILTILPLPEWARPFRPAWHSLILIYWCIATPQRVGVGVGWFLGLMIDVITNTLLGQHALELAITAFITTKLHRRMRVFPLWQQAIGVFLLLTLEEIFSIIVMGAIHRPTPDLSYWATPFIGMLLWPWISVILRSLRQRFKVN